MPKYKVKSPLNHDQKDYKIGSAIELTDEQAAPLLGHTLALPGEELTEKQLAQGAAAVQDAAAELAEGRADLAAGELALKQAQEAFAAERAEFEKSAKAKK